MDHIRKQYEKRLRSCVLGTSEEPVEWATLGLGSKVSAVIIISLVDWADIYDRFNWCTSYVRYKWKILPALEVY